ncbi:MAG: hypothetical protein IMY71_05055 [Bacteroidetes bacterium]|nr:hypothetical protein [Bacteroidota bacterium]
MKKKKFYILKWAILIALIVSAFTSCTKEEAPNFPKNESSTLKCATVDNEVECDLIAGQYINVGTVLYSDDGVNLEVQYVTSDGWSLSELHLYVGPEEGIPTNKKGNPVIGHFPYSEESLPDVTTSYTFTVPLGDDECYAVAAHAVVYDVHGNVETAWAKCEYKPIITLKTWLKDPDGSSGHSTFWAVSSGEPISTSDWCSIMGTNVYVKGDKYSLVSNCYSNPGSITVTDDGSNLKVTVKANDDLLLYRTYLFVGTKEQLAAYGICPNYPAFPYKIENVYSDTHVLEAPLPPTINNSISFQEAFGANSWGWFSQYCKN